jgi:hypothetical protein
MSRCASPATLAPVMAFARCRSRASNDGAKRIDSGVVMTTLYLLHYTRRLCAETGLIDDEPQRAAG